MTDQPNFTILNESGRKLSYTKTNFPGGEIGVTVDYSPRFVTETVIVNFYGTLRNHENFFELALLKNAIRELYLEKISRADYKEHLRIGYFPYSRQDRVCSQGESFSAKVYADLLNSLKFDVVTVLDPHSDVIGGLIDNVVIQDRLHLINQNQQLIQHCLRPNTVFIAPDAGANKITAKIARYFNHENFIRADKLRELSTGKILETVVYVDSLEGKHVVCVDDICDGGKTFIELAKVCKQKGCKSFTLYVTHGIFSKGAQILFDNGVDVVFTTNAYKEIESGENFHVFNVFKF